MILVMLLRIIKEGLSVDSSPLLNLLRMNELLIECKVFRFWVSLMLNNAIARIVANRLVETAIHFLVIISYLLRSLHGVIFALYMTMHFLISLECAAMQIVLSLVKIQTCLSWIEPLLITLLRLFPATNGRSNLLRLNLVKHVYFVIIIGHVLAFLMRKLLFRNARGVVSSLR